MAETISAGRARSRPDTAAAARLRERLSQEHVDRHPRSRALHERARRALPGGDTRTVTFFAPFPVYIDHGAGCRLIDVDGHGLLDLLGNFTSMIWGHAHPRIVEAIRAQAGRGTGYAAPVADQIRLGEMLCERLPSVDRIRFVNSGTEATLHAIRAARAFTGRDAIVKMEGGYHGSHDAVEISVHPDLDAAGPAARPRAVRENRGVPQAAVGDTLVAPFNDQTVVEAVLHEHRDRIAAVIVEPVMGAAGTIPPREGFLQFLRAITSELGILLIFDEVISFRLGPGGAQGRFGVRPDLTALGKTIGGGLPVGAFGGREEIMRLFDPGRPRALVQSGTFNANPVTVAAGIAGLELLTADELDRINRLGDRLRAGLQALFDASPLRARVTGLGSLLTVHFTDADVTHYRDAAAADPDLSAAFHLALLREGVFCASRGMMATSLPMTDAEVDEALRAARAALDRMLRALEPTSAAAAGHPED